MRHLVFFGTVTLAAASGLAILGTGDAAGQQSAPRFLPGRGTGIFAVEAVPEGEQESDELSKLNARDAQLGQEADSLAKQLAESANEKQRGEIKDKLQATLAEQFDTQQKVRELEVARIEARVKKLRDVISKRNEARRSIIEKRLEQLAREADGLGWNSPTTGGHGYGAVNVPQAATFYAPFFENRPVPAPPAPTRR